LIELISVKYARVMNKKNRNQKKRGKEIGKEEKATGDRFGPVREGAHGPVSPDPEFGNLVRH
jgi:hypothetical protein